MVATRGMPERSRWQRTGVDLRAAFVLDAVRERGYVHYADPDDDLALLTPPSPGPLTHTEELEIEERERRSRTPESKLRAIANTLGVEPGSDELDGLQLGAMDAEPAPEPVAAPEPPSEPDTQSRAYVVREGDWRERHGLRRRRKTVPPSRTPEARRDRHLRAKAERLGISVADADRMTQRRQNTTRAGHVRHLRAERHSSTSGGER